MFKGTFWVPYRPAGVVTIPNGNGLVLSCITRDYTPHQYGFHGL